MSTLLWPKLDSGDIVQVAWMRFFEDFLPARHFDTSAHLLAFVCGLAYREGQEAHRHYLDCDKRDARREQSLGDVLGRGAEPAGPGADPSLVAMARDEWEALLSRLPADERAVLELLREGYDCGEVAQRLGVCDRTVRRSLERARRKAG
jgi:RNA polymerase sigma factor (sigma-70 family)